MFSSLHGDKTLFKQAEWMNAGDFATEIRFFPHAFQCYQRANEVEQSETALRKISDVVDKITNVLEEIPEKLKPYVEEIRLSNPLDPAKWLGIANLILKEYSDELSQSNLKEDTQEAAHFALAFAIYCSKRSGNSIADMNSVLKELTQDLGQGEPEKKLDLVSLSQKKRDEAIKVVVFGDNISLGLMPDWSILFSETYHYLWSKEVDKKISLANNSISGAGVLDLCLYTKRDILNYKPDLALIMLGNVDAWLKEDTALSFGVLYSSMLKIIKAQGIEPVVISAIPQIIDNYPEMDIPPGVKRDEYKIQAYVDADKKAAYQNDVCFVDAYSCLPSEEKYFANAYNQPNLEGQTLIQKALLEKTIY